MKYVSGVLTTLTLLGFFATFMLSLKPFMEKDKWAANAIIAKRVAKKSQAKQRRARPAAQLASGSLR